MKTVIYFVFGIAFLIIALIMTGFWIRFGGEAYFYYAVVEYVIGVIIISIGSFDLYEKTYTRLVNERGVPNKSQKR